MKFQLVVLLLMLAVSSSLAKPSERTLNKSAALKHIFDVSKPKVTSANHANLPPAGVKFAVVVQQSKDLLNTLLGMQNVAAEVVKQLNGLKDWAKFFTFWEFNDVSTYYITKSPYFENIPQEITDLINDRRNAPRVCTNLVVIDTLISVLSDPDTVQGMEVFLYVYGGAALDDAKLKTLYGLIDKFDAKVHVTQSASSSLCYNQDFNAPQLKVISDIAQYSGGSYSLSGLGSTLLALPLQYDSETLKIETYATCPDSKQTTFTVDSSTWTLALHFFGEIQGFPTLTGPNGEKVALRKIYTSSTDQFYVAGDTTTPAQKLPSGDWTVTFDTFESDDPLPCGIRIDAQSSA